jgi:hypothetical protein
MFSLLLSLPLPSDTCLRTGMLGFHADRPITDVLPLVACRGAKDNGLFDRSVKTTLCFLLDSGVEI